MTIQGFPGRVLAGMLTTAVWLGSHGRPALGQQPPRRAPLTLSQVLDSVSRTHPLIQAAEARVRAARGARSTAGRLGNPMLGYQVENIPVGSGPTVPLEREAMTMLTLPLEPLYQRSSRLHRATADVLATQAEALAEQRRVALMAARAFYRVALASVRLASARSITGLLDTVVTYNQSRVREGLAAESDLIRSEVERDRALAEVDATEAELAQASSELSGFLGDSSTTAISVSTDSVPLVVTAAQATVDSHRLESALTQRPDVIAARERLASANAGVGVEQSMFIRQFGLTMGLKRTAGTSSLLAGATIPIPLFDQNRGEVGRAAGERDAARLELAAAERTARAELSGLFAASRLLTERLQSQLADSGAGPYLARLGEIRRIALGAYQEGAIPLIQVLDAARASADARMIFFMRVYAQHESVLAYLVALGEDPGSFLHR